MFSTRLFIKIRLSTEYKIQFDIIRKLRDAFFLKKHLTCFILNRNKVLRVLPENNYIKKKLSENTFEQFLY